MGVGVKVVVGGGGRWAVGGGRWAVGGGREGGWGGGGGDGVERLVNRRRSGGPSIRRPDGVPYRGLWNRCTYRSPWRSVDRE